MQRTLYKQGNLVGLFPPFLSITLTVLQDHIAVTFDAFDSECNRRPHNNAAG